MMFCKNCGQNNPDGTVFCPNCGQKNSEAPAVSSNQAPVYQAPAPSYAAQQRQAYSAPAAKPKKKHGCLTAFLIVLAVIIVGGAAAYFLLPGLSKPVDLGVRSTRQAYESAMNKLRIIKDEAPSRGEAEDYMITYGAPQEIGTSLTSEELTSFFNENRPPYYAVKDVQVRINEDGSIEASARLDTSYVFNKMLSGQYSKQDAQSALPMLGLIPDNVNVYFKVSGGVEDNQVVGLSVDSVSVMGIPIPLALINDNMSFITSTLDNYISSECARVGARIDRVRADNGSIDIKGSLPSSVERKPIG